MVRLLIFNVVLTIVLATGCECNPAADIPDPPPVDDAEPVAAEDFGDRLVEAACSSYRDCDDEVFRGGVFQLFRLPVDLSFDDEMPHDVVDDYRDEYAEISDVVDQQRPPTLPADRCRTFAEIVTGFLGFHPDDLRTSIEEATVEYDAEAAGRCIARIASPPAVCDESRTARGDEFNMQQYRAVAERHETRLEQHYQPCNEVLKGTLSTGQPCRHIYECDEGNCEWHPGKESGECGPDRGDFWLLP